MPIPKWSIWPRRVQVVVDPDIDKLYPEQFPNQVEVILKNGQRYETRIDFPKGSAEHPMSFAEVAGKFRSLASPVAPGEQTEKIIDVIGRLEGLEDIRELTALLA